MRYSIIAEDTHKAELKKLFRMCRKYNVHPNELRNYMPLWMLLATPEEHEKILQKHNKEWERKLEYMRMLNKKIFNDYDIFREQVKNMK